jgi:hypothetical protein
MAETLGNAARIKRIKGFSGGVIADVNGLHGGSWFDLPDWQLVPILPSP